MKPREFYVLQRDDEGERRIVEGARSPESAARRAAILCAELTDADETELSGTWCVHLDGFSLWIDCEEGTN